MDKKVLLQVYVTLKRKTMKRMFMQTIEENVDSMDTLDKEYNSALLRSEQCEEEALHASGNSKEEHPIVIFLRNRQPFKRIYNDDS